MQIRKTILIDIIISAKKNINILNTSKKTLFLKCKKKNDDYTKKYDVMLLNMLFGLCFVVNKIKYIYFRNIFSFDDLRI